MPDVSNPRAELERRLAENEARRAQEHAQAAERLRRKAAA